MDLKDQLQRTLGANYTLDRELGGGGMSRVFVAEDTSLRRKVVVKVLLPELAASVNVERFRREIHLAAMLQHPHIVPVLSAGVSDGLPYYTMPFIEGESLRARLARVGQLDVSEATKILRDVVSALSYAHEHGVVHRDIKPENILLSGRFAVVTDFGVAKALSASTKPGAAITSIGVVLGTPAYMAPEQAAGDPSADHRADIYSVGAVAYEMLSGEKLFADRPGHAIFAAHAIDVPPSLTQKARGIPPALADLVARCLEKDPKRRPQSEEELLRELEAIGTGGGGGRGFAGLMRFPFGRGGKKRWFVGAVGAVTALALVYGAYQIMGQRATGDGTAASPASPLAIAVLPFANMSGVRENEYFSDGMTEELIHALGTVKGLEVAARTSSFAFKGKEATVQEIGQQLHVSHVLEGSVRQSGTRLRVTAELINAANGYRVWSNSYDREMKDIFQVQDEISQSIVSALSSTLGGSPNAVSRRAPRDLVAYDLYLKGDFFWNKRTSEGLQTAAAYFEQAITRDSTYALAYVGLADSYAVLAAFGYLEPKQTYALAKPAALHALALDSTLAEAHTSLGFIHLYYDLDPAAARREFVRALTLDPRYATAHLFDAWYYLAVEDLPNAIKEVTAARDLEPLSLIINTRVGTMLRYAERYDEAEQQIRKTLELDANFAIGHDELARIVASNGRFGEAVVNARRSAELGYSHADGILGYSLALSGDKPAAQRIVDSLVTRSETEYVAPFDIGLIYAGLGDDAAAIRWLARCKEVRDHEAPHVRIDPLLKRLRKDPRFVRITSGVL